jgi:radical SAM protein with 4Fe4S-binding SPASM domain
MDQARAMGFGGVVSLSYYNEPLFDERIHEVGGYAQRAGFRKVQLCTNGDMLNEKTARRLDGCFDQIRIALYEERTQERMAAIQGMFATTAVLFGSGLHQLTHYSPAAIREIAGGVNEPCYHVGRNMIINYNGDVLACCDEIVPHFDLGNVCNSSLQDLWEGKQDLVRTLSQRGGRRNYPYCMTCPRRRRTKPKCKVVPIETRLNVEATV